MTASPIHHFPMSVSRGKLQATNSCIVTRRASEGLVLLASLAGPALARAWLPRAGASLVGPALARAFLAPRWRVGLRCAAPYEPRKSAPCSLRKIVQIK